jgi:hypothetical protein
MAATVCIEQLVVTLMDQAGQALPALEKLITDRRQSLTVYEKSLRDSPSSNAELAGLLHAFASWQASIMAEIHDAAQALQRLHALCETSFAFYDAVVTSTHDEAVMLMAQNQTERMLELIAQLRRPR